jgi:hypothetical protein
LHFSQQIVTSSLYQSDTGAGQISASCQHDIFVATQRRFSESLTLILRGGIRRLRNQEIDMESSTLELALAVSNCMANQLDRSSAAVITIPRDVAELALAFTEAAIESLRNQSCRPGPALN